MNSIQQHKDICISLSTLCLSAKKLFEESDANVSDSVDEMKMLTSLSDFSLILTPAHIHLSTSDQTKFLEKNKSSKFIVLRIPDLEADAPVSSLSDGYLIQKLASLTLSGSSRSQLRHSERLHHPTSVEKDFISLAARAIQIQILERQRHTELLPSYSANTVEQVELQSERSLFSPLRYLFKTKSILNHMFLGSHRDENIHDGDFDEDVDDAILHSGRDPLDDELDDGRTVRQHARTQVSSHLIEQDNLLINDVMWNIDLIIECWDILVQYAQDQVLRKKADGEDDHQTTTVSIHSKQYSGIFLYRHGYDRRSFYQFCKDCSEHRSNSGAIKALKSTTAVDLMLALLIETKKAILTKDEHIVILLPNTTLSADLSDCENKVSEATLCVFKIGETIQMIEHNIDKLGRQADDMRLKALHAKRVGNTKYALLYMKRWKDCTNEIERSSSLLLNLDSSFNTLKRAMNDKEIFSTYELMNEAMKSVRKDFDVSHVEDIITEIEDHNSYLNNLHESIHQNSDYGHDELSDASLLTELADLTHETTTSNDDKMDSLEERVIHNDAPSHQLSEEQDPKLMELLPA